jgi:5-methylcytosine-specific restriction enzyme A
MCPTINLGKRKQRDVTANMRLSQSWYNTKEWKKLRKQKIMNDPLCENCLKHNRTTPATEVHHVIPITEQNKDEMLLNWDDLQSLCGTCHRQIQDQLRKNN